MKLAHCLLGALLSLAAAAAPAQSYPNKPIRIVVTFPPGGAPDILARLFADKAQLGQNIVIDNKAGAGGNIGADFVAKAPADGYTLVMGTVGTHSINGALYSKMPYDMVKDFVPVALLTAATNVIAAHPSVGPNNLKDFVSYVKANPGKLNYASQGIGSLSHVGTELLLVNTGTDMTHVPYKEVSQLFMSVSTNDVAWSLGTLPSSSGAYKAGKLRYIAVASNKRLPQVPEVPTAAEAGGPADFDVNAFVVLVSPKGIAPALRAKINADVAKVLTDAEIKTRFDTFAFEPISWTAEEIARNAEAKSKVYEQLVKKANISLE